MTLLASILFLVQGNVSICLSAVISYAADAVAGLEVEKHWKCPLLLQRICFWTKINGLALYLGIPVMKKRHQSSSVALCNSGECLSADCLFRALFKQVCEKSELRNSHRNQC